MQLDGTATNWLPTCTLRALAFELYIFINRDVYYNEQMELFILRQATPMPSLEHSLKECLAATDKLAVLYHFLNACADHEAEVIALLIKLGALDQPDNRGAAAS